VPVGSLEWVVLDLGETLVDETRSWARHADHLGVPHLTFFGVLGAVIAGRRDHREVFDHFPAEGDPPAWSVETQDLYDDALPCLLALRERGYPVAVMANQPVEALPLLRSLPLDAVAASAEWGVHKPDPAFFARVCEEVGAPAERVAYVGDRVDNDVLPAKAAGMVAVHLRRGPWGYLHATWPEAAEADLRNTGLGELAPALDALGANRQ
jgi:HAD superfamily hydrolase (TIGR01509 family)